MPPADETHYPLAAAKPAPRVRRSISARDYSLPKPYRKKRFVEDEPKLSTLRKGLLAFSGLVVASLIAALALLAKENFESPPVVVIPAPKPAAPLPVALADASPAFLPMPVPVRPPMAAVRDDAPPAVPHGRAMLPALAKPVHRAHLAPATQAPPPDPDVVLISAILLLTAPGASAPDDPALAACNATAVGDSGCPAIHGMKP